jgi:alginate O-acetyltransferase complex protein AlgI
LGLGKKVLLANNLSIIGDQVFGSDVSTLTPELAWLGATAYTLQIYLDFSGYSDMAVGLGKMFGFNFPENFNFPFIAKSITEFWRRWHISLGMWFKDYVYIPLGGNRGRVFKQIRNIIIVWFLTGWPVLSGFSGAGKIRVRAFVGKITRVFTRLLCLYGCAGGLGVILLYRYGKALGVR